MIALDTILPDPVFQERCRTHGISDPIRFACQDPYHRYVRILQTCERLQISLSGAKVLDLGCLRPELASILGLTYGVSVTGIDQWDMLDAWQGKLQHPMRFYNCNIATDSPSLFREKECFDVVFALEIIEHMIDTDAFMKRIAEVLAPDGWLVISTPNISSLRNRCLIPLGSYPAHMEFRNVIHHVRLYNPKVLATQLRENGFIPVRTFGINFLPYRGPMHWAPYRLLSESLANKLASLCPQFCCIARAGSRARSCQ